MKGQFVSRRSFNQSCENGKFVQSHLTVKVLGKIRVTKNLKFSEYSIKIIC